MLPAHDHHTPYSNWPHSLPRSIKRLYSNSPNRPSTVLPQFTVPRPILKPLVHRLANLPYRQDELALRLTRRIRTRSRIQRVESSLERRHGWGNFHRQLHECSEEGRVLALEVCLDDAGVEGVGCNAWVGVSACGSNERLSLFAASIENWSTYLERCNGRSALWRGGLRLALSASSVAWWHRVVSILLCRRQMRRRHSQQHSHAFLFGHVDIVQENMLRAQQRRHLRGQVDDAHPIFACGCRCSRQKHRHELRN